MYLCQLCFCPKLMSKTVRAVQMQHRNYHEVNPKPFNEGQATRGMCFPGLPIVDAIMNIASHVRLPS